MTVFRIDQFAKAKSKLKTLLYGWQSDIETTVEKVYQIERILD